jgi:hypothetical protein
MLTARLFTEEVGGVLMSRQFIFKSHKKAHKKHEIFLVASDDFGILKRRNGPTLLLFRQHKRQESIGSELL